MEMPTLMFSASGGWKWMEEQLLAIDFAKLEGWENFKWNI